MYSQEMAPKATMSEEDSQAKHGTDGGSPFDQTIDSDSPITVSGTIGKSIDEFKELLSQAGLMSVEDLQTFMERGLTEGATISGAEELAAALVDSKRLTDFQLQELREGKIGSLVLGNYVVLEKIGAGGMGVVYKARQRRMKRDVALKVLPEALTQSKDAVARFHREVEAAAKLQHSNIAVAYDADESEGVHFLAMELVDGPNLSQYVKQHGPLPLPHALVLCLQAAKGLKHAHDEGVIHRDIKPGNLMVDQRGTLKILDMGLAHLAVDTDGSEDISELTQSGRVMGTVDYMAPEQAIDAKRADNRADIYSVGCTLYYLVSGKPLSPDGSITQKLMWHQTEEVPKLSTMCEDVSETLDAVAMKMLGKKPEDRQQSMAEVITQFEAVLSEMSFDPATLPKLAGALAEIDFTPSIGSATAFDRRTLMEQTMGGAATETKSSRGLWVALAVVLAGVLAGGAVMLGMFDGDDPPPVVDGGNNGGGDGTKDSGGLAAVPGPGPKNVVPEKDPEVLADELFRQKIDWIFAHQGSVQVLVPDGVGGEIVRTRDELPEGKFAVNSVQLQRTALGEADLAKLAELQSIEELSLRETKLPAGSLDTIGSLSNLWSLDLSKTTADDGVAAAIKKLEGLRDLNLSGTNVTDATLRQLAGLSKLEKIYLSDTLVGDEGVKKLYALTNLKLLSLNGTKISATGHRDLVAALPQVEISWDGADIDRVVARKILDKGGKLTIANLATGESGEYTRRVDLPAARFQIQIADLSGNPAITDEDLVLLSELRNLESIDLDGTSVTDLGLSNLKSLSTLKVIDLGAMQLDDTTIAAIKRTLPETDIKRSITSQRETAKWVLASGGRVTVTTPDGVKLSDLRVESDLPQGPFTIRGIRLVEQSDIVDGDLTHFRGLAKLERLLLARTGISDKGIEHILGCTSLRDLDMSDTQISDSGIRQLARLRSLRQLKLAGTAVTAQGLRSLIQLPELTRLSLSRTRVANDDLVHLKGMASLAWLSLSGTPSTDAALSSLGSLRGLKELFVTKTEITDAGIEELKATLDGCRVEADPADPQRLAARWVLEQRGTASIEVDGAEQLLERLSELPRDACVVRKVDLSSLDRLRASEISKLRYCDGLMELNLAETETSDRALSTIAKLGNLKRLSLAKTRVTDKGLSGLTQLASLESLDLSQTRITGRGFAALSKLEGLRELKLDDCRLSDRTIAVLGDLTALETLTLRNAGQLGDQGLEALAPLTSLTRLDLGGTKVTDAIGEQLATYEKLATLDLSRTKVTDAVIEQLGELEGLRRLRLDGTELTDSSLAALGEMETLRNLDVRQTKVTKAAVDQLKEANPNLRVQMSTRRRPDENQQGGNGGAGGP